MTTPRHARLRRFAGCTAATLVLAATVLVTGSVAVTPSAFASAGSGGPGVPVPSVAVDWTTAAPSTSPPKLVGATAAYDPANRTVVLFGGEDSSGTYSADTWTWNGQTWQGYSSTSLTTHAPPARAFASLAYDPSSNQLVLFGGRGSSGYYSDTWAWNGQSWSQMTTSICPGARASAGLGYDALGDLVLFGGTGPSGSSAATTTTTSNTSSATAPTISGCSVAQSATTTQTLSDTWQWNGVTWTPAAAGPPALAGTSVAYDSTNNTTVLFGGTAATGNPSNQTWTWSGTAWTQQSPKTSPSARSNALLADIPTLSGVLISGGAGSGGAALGDAWLWTGNDWMQPRSAGTEVANAEPVGDYDSSQSRLVVFDGSDGSGSSGVTQLAEPLISLTSTSSSSSTSTPPTTVAPTNPTSGGTPTGHKSTPPARSSLENTTTTTVANSGGSGTPAAVGGLSLSTGEHTVKRGTAVRLAGGGFRPGTTVTITFHSKPYFVGRFTASDAGDFAAYAEVPPSASAGVHHFEATGTASDGKVATLTAEVYVVAPAGGHGTSSATKAALVVLALAIPGGAWLAMAGVGRRRRRQAVSPVGSAPAGAGAEAG